MIVACWMFISMNITCSKDTSLRPYCYLQVKFGDNEDYDFLEKINGTWSFADQ